MNKCSNCENELLDNNKYCPECGQKTQLDLSLGLLFKDTLANYFSLDAKLFRSFIPLFFRPGYLAEVFTSGKRQQYLHPAKFYLFSTILLVLVLSINSSVNNVGNLKGNDSLNLGLMVNDKIDSLEIENKLDSLVVIEGIDSSIVNDLGHLNKFNEIRKAAKDENATMEEKITALGWEPGYNRLVTFGYMQIAKLNNASLEEIKKVAISSTSIALFFFIPFFAFLLKIFFRKNKKPYVDHLVFTFYLFTFVFLILFFNVVYASFYPISTVLAKASFIGILVYLVFSFWQFYNRSILRSITKSISLIIVFLFALIPLSILILFLLIVTF